MIFRTSIAIALSCLGLSLFVACGSDVNSGCTECSQQSAPLADALELEPELQGKSSSDLKPVQQNANDQLDVKSVGTAPLGDVKEVSSEDADSVRDAAETLKSKQKSSL